MNKLIVIVIAVAVVVGGGAFFGWYPARRAAPRASALRYE